MKHFDDLVLHDLYIKVLKKFGNKHASEKFYIIEKENGVKILCKKNKPTFSKGKVIPKYTIEYSINDVVYIRVWAQAGTSMIYFQSPQYILMSTISGKR